MRQLTRYYCISKSVLFTIKNVALQEKKKKKQTKNASELIIIEIPLFVIRKKKIREGRTNGVASRGCMREDGPRYIVLFEVGSGVAVHRWVLLGIEPIRVLELTIYRNTLSRGCRRLRCRAGPVFKRTALRARISARFLD